MKKILPLFLFLAIAVINIPVAALAQSNVWATAYYAGWMQGYNNTGYMPAQNVDYSAFTHLIHFALVPRADGTLDDASNSVTAFNANEVVTRAHAAGRKVVICVGGWATDVAFRGATNSTNRSKFITNIVNLMKARGYDGVDIDWEPLSTSDGPQYVTFITELRAALDAVSPRPLLMAATAWAPGVFAQVKDKFDQINLMTYDLAGAWGGWVTWHNSAVTDGGFRFPSTGAAPPSSEGMLNNFTAAGIPASKLGIGIDFYGYVWSGGAGTSTGGATEPRQSWTTAPSVQANVPYYTIMKNYYQSQYYRWDSGPQAAYLSIDNAGSTSDKFITYDDEKTVAAKVGYAKTKGIGGVIIWELGGGYRADQPTGQKDVLLQAVKQALGGSTPSVDTTPPTISISFPSNGATLSGLVTVTANASDNIAVEGVQFKVDGNNIGGQDMASPYSISLNTLPFSNASHTISAVARDAAGNTATSSVSVTVLNSSLDTTPPAISLLTPANGSSVAGTVTLSASASDDVGVSGVQFKVDGVNSGSEVTNSPYSTTWNSTQATNGSHTISAVARDAAGNTSTSSVNVTVSNTTTPPPGNSTDLMVFDESLNFPWVNSSWSATVTFGSTEQGYSSSSSIKTATTAAWAAFSLHYGSWGSTGINPASYKSLDFMVYGAASGTSLTIFFENDAAQSFPKVNYGTISAGQWSFVSIPMSQLNPDNQTINRVDIQEVSGSTKTFYIDNLRLTGTSSVGVPSVPIVLSPSNGATGVAVNPSLSWNASTNASSYQLQVSTVNTFSTTVLNQSAITGTSFAVSGLSNNTTYFWRVNATNSAGTSGWSSVSSFTIAAAPDTVAPTVAITAPTQGSTVSGSITVSANAADNQKLVGVQFKVDGDNAGAEVTAAPFGFSWNTALATNGSHTLTAVARDSAGNLASASVTVTVSNVTPPTSSTDLTVYEDAVASPWINASWSASVTFETSEQKFAGTNAIRVVQNAWGALRLHSGPWGAQVDVKGTQYSSFEFAVYGGSVGLSIGVYFENDLNQKFPSVKYIYVPVNQWKVLSFSMSQLNPNKQVIHRIVIQDLSGRSRTFYVDNIRFIGNSPAASAYSGSVETTVLNELPSIFSLSQNFPNPFNPTTRISYALPEVASVTVEVYNAIGQSVAVLQSGHQQAGAHQVEFNARGLATGIYFYRLTALSADGQQNLFVETRKMLLAK